MSAAWFDDGTYEMIKNMDDVERVLEERLGTEAATSIMDIIETHIDNKVKYEVEQKLQEEVDRYGF